MEVKVTGYPWAGLNVTETVTRAKAKRDAARNPEIPGVSFDCCPPSGVARPSQCDDYWNEPDSGRAELASARDRAELLDGSRARQRDERRGAPRTRQIYDHPLV